MKARSLDYHDLFDFYVRHFPGEVLDVVDPLLSFGGCESLPQVFHAVEAKLGCSLVTGLLAVCLLDYVYDVLL